MFIDIKNLSFSYNTGKNILSDINIGIKGKEFISILGFSGSGKSTLLKILAGILTQYSGDIYINNINIKLKKHVVSYMPQSDLLLPFKTVFNNLKIPLYIKGVGLSESKSIIEKYIEEFKLGFLLNKYPNELSGGEKQRISLLRTMLIGSKIILLDEPFNSLDTITKSKMQEFLYYIYKKYHYTIILVTHDIDEAIYFSNQIYLINNDGKIINKLSINFKNRDNYKTIILDEKFIEYKSSILKLLRL